MSAPMTKEEMTKLFDEIVGTKTADLAKELRGEMEKNAGARRSRYIDSVTVDERTGQITIDPSEKKGLRAAQFVRIVAAAKREGKDVLHVAKKWKADEVVSALENKSLQAQSAEDGGFLVPEPVQQEVIELLRAAVVVEASGAVGVPMLNGNLSMNYQETSATATYEGECIAIPSSSPKFGRLKLSAKKLTALVPICNDFLRYGMDMADQIVRDDLVQTLAVRKDLALIRDDGSQDTPKGLRWLAPAANVVARTLDAGFVTLETITNDLANAAQRLESANIRMRRPGWIMHPRTKWFLFRQRDGLGNQVFREELATGMLFGFPVKTTTNIPVTLGTSGDESEIYLVDFASIMIGEALNLEISVSEQASYVSPGGTTSHGFQSDDTLVRALMAHDINARFRGAEISIISAVDWI